MNSATPSFGVQSPAKANVAPIAVDQLRERRLAQSTRKIVLSCLVIGACAGAFTWLAPAVPPTLSRIRSEVVELRGEGLRWLASLQDPAAWGLPSRLD